MNTAYSCVVDDHAPMLDQCFLWVVSLLYRRHAAPEQIYVHALQAVDSPLLPWLRGQGVRVVEVAPFDSRSPHCNKLQQLPTFDGGDYDQVVLMDCDTAWVGSAPLPSFDTVAAKIADRPNPAPRILERIFSNAGVGAPDWTSVSFPPNREESRTDSNNCNGGVYFIASDILPALREAWPRWARWCLERRALFGPSHHFDQVSYALAARELGLQTRLLDLAWNYPTHYPDWPLPDLEPQIIHFHQRFTPRLELMPAGAPGVDAAMEQFNRDLAPWLSTPPHRAIAPPATAGGVAPGPGQPQTTENALQPPPVSDPGLQDKAEQDHTRLLRDWLSQAEALTALTLESWRWRVGDRLARQAERLLGRTAPVLAADRLRELFAQFHRWETEHPPPADEEREDVGFFDTPYGSFRVPEGDLLFSSQLRNFGGHTRPELALLLSFVSPGDTVVDVGAHIGTFAVPLARKVTNSGRVLAFEPHPRNLDFLRRNLQCNGVEANVDILPFAVSDRPQRLYVSHYDLRNTGATEFSVSQPSGDAATCTAIAVALDPFLPQVTGPGPMPAVIKIDAEGFELKVLQGAEELIGRHRPLIYAEINVLALHKSGALPRDIERFLMERGYHLFRNAGERNAPNDEFVLSSLESLAEAGEFFDFLAIHREDARLAAALDACRSGHSNS